ncbi:MAG TPA: hypothetical protein VG099_31410, partial [Gemmataceae bacterium]|nr:hypothetical protein [Gemmataceae bacterium]
MRVPARAKPGSGKARPEPPLDQGTQPACNRRIFCDTGTARTNFQESDTMRKATMATLLLAGLAVWQSPRARAEVK